MEFVKQFLNKAVPSWTIWAGVILTILSYFPADLSTIVGWFGDVSPETSVRLAAAVMFLTRLRSIVVPILTDLTAKKDAEDDSNLGI